MISNILDASGDGVLRKIVSQSASGIGIELNGSQFL